VKPNLRWICISLLLGTLAFYVAKRGTTMTLAQTSIEVVPFVFEAETYNFESDPKGKLVHKRVTARRADGAMANIESVGLLEWGTSTRKVTYVDGTWATVYDLIAAKTTWRMKPTELAAVKERLRNPPVNCLFNTAGNPTFIRNDTVLGHEVAVIESVSDGERGTFWRARDLGCEELRWRYESIQADGTFRLKSEERPISLKIGNPDSGFFDIAANSKEMRPSDAHRLFFEKLPIPEDEATKHMSEQMDMKYLSGSH
jgi:hypothetical protein